jgi:hypothetical protein
MEKIMHIAPDSQYTLQIQPLFMHFLSSSLGLIFWVALDIILHQSKWWPKAV